MTDGSVAPLAESDRPIICTRTRSRPFVVSFCCVRFALFLARDILIDVWFTTCIDIIVSTLSHSHSLVHVLIVTRCVIDEAAPTAEAPDVICKPYARLLLRGGKLR